MDGCRICGATTPTRGGVPTYNGDLVSDDFPLEPEGNWPACGPCFEAHARGQLKTWDGLYTRRPPLGVPLVDGGGI